MCTRSRLLVVPFVLLLGLGLVGCGDSDDSPSAVPSAASGPVGLQMRKVTTTATDSGAGAPTLDQQTLLDSFDCSGPHETAPAAEPMTACDADSQTYLLEPASIDGGVESAEASESAGGGWVVNIVLGPASSAKLAELSGSLVGTPDQLALVLQGEVLAAPTVDGRITNGQLQIAGAYTQDDAKELAKKIQAGA